MTAECQQEAHWLRTRVGESAVTCGAQQAQSNSTMNLVSALLLLNLVVTGAVKHSANASCDFACLHAYAFLAVTAFFSTGLSCINVQSIRFNTVSCSLLMCRRADRYRCAWRQNRSPRERLGWRD